MADITKVEVGDEFKSILTMKAVEVLKIWFEFSEDDDRWETSVEWRVRPKFGDYYNVTGKGRDFVKAMRDGDFFRMSKGDEFSFNPEVAQPSSPPASSLQVTASTAPNPSTKKWEDDFRRNAARYGLSPSDLGRTVTLNSGKRRYYTIVGAKPRNWKMPILVKGKQGGIYKITAEKAKAGLL